MVPQSVFRDTGVGHAEEPELQAHIRLGLNARQKGLKIPFDNCRAFLFPTPRRTMNSTFANLTTMNAQSTAVHQEIWRSCRNGVGNVEVIF